MIEITREIATKVVEVVDAGLTAGLGDPVPGKMCIEAAVCYAMGLPHGDNPSCVSPALRGLKIHLNDARWSSRRARAKGLRKLAVLQLGSAGVLDEVAFVQRLVYLVEAATFNIDRWLADATKCWAAAAREWVDKASSDEASIQAAEAASEAINCAAEHAAQFSRPAAAAADAVLIKFADDVAEILIDMNVPGVVWLPLLD